MNEKLIEQLIEGCRNGDRRSQADLYKHFYAYGVTVALHYLNDADTAKAVYNEAMFKVFTNIAQYKTDAPFKGWLRRIVINAAIDHNRKYIHESSMESEDIAMTIPTYSPVFSKLETDDILLVINKLAPSYRSVFLLHNIEGLKFYEIAEQLNITEGGAKTLYYKAKLKLQTILIDYFN
jgi:RNA polymerase sigma factor (sigma-70 family)